MEDLLKRITFSRNVLCGKPVIRDLRAVLLYAHHMVAREEVFDRAGVQ